MQEQDKQLFLKVHDRDEIVFEGRVSSLTSTNDKGVFDVLEKHANFISLIFGELIIRTIEGEDKTIDIKNGVLKVERGMVDVFIGVEL